MAKIVLHVELDVLGDKTPEQMASMTADQLSLAFMGMDLEENGYEVPNCVVSVAE